MTAARRATSACRPSGLSWRRSSTVRSCTRVRLACIASSLRSAFSLRLRCLRTPAASSMKPRRSSGPADSTASSWPCPTMTCISRPMPRVGQQLLDVEQPARLAVDGVLRAAVAEHDPRDGDLGVVDRQRAVGVVDGEADLGAAQRGPAAGAAGAGRAGEDDVLHLAAAQRLGALLAHDPGEGVDDVGLAGAVRPDDAGDARLEVEGRRGREGLEPLEGEALQVHARELLDPGTACRSVIGPGACEWGVRRAGKAAASLPAVRPRQAAIRRRRAVTSPASPARPSARTPERRVAAADRAQQGAAGGGSGQVNGVDVQPADRVDGVDDVGLPAGGDAVLVPLPAPSRRPRPRRARWRRSRTP